MSTFTNRVNNIKIVALDVDGVLTNGDLIYSKDGEILKIFNVKDGLALKLLIEKGFLIVVITARRSDIVTLRMKELGIKFVYQGIENKVSVLDDLLGQFMLGWENLAYIGDDLNDIPVLKKAHLPCCPSDASKDVIVCCHYVCKKEGGRGAVREVAELILKEQHKI